jgi:hypothetical protein
MDKPTPINVYLITDITELPIDGEKSEKYLKERLRKRPYPMRLK